MGPIPMVDLSAEREFLGESVMNNIRDCIASNSFIMGRWVSQLEDKLAEYVSQASAGDSVQCIAVSSGTDALQMVLMALSIGAGDEVVTVPFTWISTAEAVSLVGASVRFVDVDSDTYNMDPRKLSDVLTPKTKAVIAVSLFGYPADLKAIRAVCDSAESTYGTTIALIEDGAQSFGARRSGEMSCVSNYTIAGTTSFFPAKPLGCYGDGGAVFTRSQSLGTALREIRVHGRSEKCARHVRIGMNGRLDAMQAAVLLAKLPRYAELARMRRAVASRYNDRLKSCPGLALPILRKDDMQDCEHIYGVYTIQCAARDALSAALTDAGIQHGKYYSVCVHQQPVYLDAPNAPTPKCQVSEHLAGQTLALPVHPFLSELDQDRIVDVVLTTLNRADEGSHQ